jgi:hypothetical protein
VLFVPPFSESLNVHAVPFYFTATTVISPFSDIIIVARWF